MSSDAPGLAPRLAPRLTLGLLALMVLVALPASGCGGAQRVKVISPETAASERADLGLGPGVRAVTSGPGVKGSPSWGPGGDRIAYTVDGYVAERPLSGGEPRRRTTRDFDAEAVAWLSGEDLAVVVAGEGGAARPLYRTSGGGEDSLEVQRVTESLLAMTPGPGGDGVIVALETGASESGLALIRGKDKAQRIYTRRIDGRITGLSLSPDDEQAVLAVLDEDGGPASFTLYTFDLARGEFESLARLDEGVQVYGSPQWTTHGIYYAAGKSEDGLYDLYRIPPQSKEPERGAGEEFAAFELSASPDGSKLAVVGRRSPSSPTNLYLLDPASGELETLTSNENMEIKTGPEDLSWSADGKRLAIVARGVVSGPSVYSARADTLIRDFYNVYEVEAG